MDTFRTSTKCPAQRDNRLIESQIKGVKNGRGPTLRGRYTEVSVSIGDVRQERVDCMIRRPLMEVKSNKNSHTEHDNRTFWCTKRISYASIAFQRASIFKRLARIIAQEVIGLTGNKRCSPFTQITRVQIWCIRDGPLENLIFSKYKRKSIFSQRRNFMHAK